MENKKFRDIVSIVGGILLSIAIVVLAFLIPLGLGFFVVLTYELLPNSVATIIIVVVAFLLVGITAISKIYTGGGSAKMFFGKNTKRKDGE